MKLSIVATLYCSASYVEEFCRRAVAAGRKVAGDDFEIVLVNDGSPDDSLTVALAQQSIDSHLRIVDLSRNFGHHKAMMTGLAHSRGDRVFLIDSDLEEEPEWVSDFYTEMDRGNIDVVFGVQNQRKGRLFERFSGWLFYRLFELSTGVNLPESAVTARLMSRRYVDALIQHDEREVFMAGLWHITGFVQQAFTVEKHSKSTTTYTLRRKLSLFINSVTSFSNAPLIGIFYTGITISMFSMFYISYLVVHWLFLGSPPGGWTSVMASIWFMSGLIISFIGIVGIYLSKIFSETKRRPYTVVRQIHEN